MGGLDYYVGVVGLLRDPFGGEVIKIKTAIAVMFCFLNPA